jgi:hypothetical protein
MTDEPLTIRLEPILRRADVLLREYFETPGDADVDLSVGVTQDNQALVLVQFGDGRVHAFTADEARAVAQSLETTLPQAPHARADEAADLILVLRLGADRAEKLAEQETQAKAS